MIDALLAVAVPAGGARPGPNRLLALAAAVSERAALSSRLELYPRGMAADRALRLALGALAGASTLTPEEIRRRVAGRYPDAACLPERPDLDALLRDAGSELRWEPDAADGQGAYRSPLRKFVTISSATSYTRVAGGASRGAETQSAAWDDTGAFRAATPARPGEPGVPGSHRVAAPTGRRGTRIGVGVRHRRA